MKKTIHVCNFTIDIINYNTNNSNNNDNKKILALGIVPKFGF